MFISFRRPDPPKKWYEGRLPALILSLVVIFVLGPIGVIFNSMSEELKQKANNETLLLYMKQQDQMQQKKDEQDAKQWEVIQKILTAPKAVTIQTPKVESKENRTLSPKEFLEYKQLSPEEQKEYREVTPEIDWSRY